MPDKFHQSPERGQKKRKLPAGLLPGKDLQVQPGDEGEDFSETLYEQMNLLVDRGQDPVRLDKFLTARIENISRNKVQQAIEGGRVLVNNKTASANYKIRPGD